MRLLSPFKALASLWGGFFDKRLWPVSAGGRTTVAMEEVSEDSALNYSAVWCATRLLCGTGAGLPLPLYRGLEGENREKERSHPVWRLLNRRPNPEMTAFNFRSVMWQWQVNWGNAYAEIVREGDDPNGELDSLWPIHPERVEVCRDEEDNRLLYRIRNKGGAHSILEANRVLHIPSIITADGICGHGVIAHARESIGAGIAAEKYGAHWFGGAAVPRAVIKHPGKWPEEARTAFRKEWDEIYSGPDGHRVALLQGGAEITPLSISNEDSQFLETRQFGVEEIARWYGIPPHMLQHLLRATFNNIEHLGINFVQYSLIEWLNVWEQCISHKLLSEREQEELFVEHNVDALQRGDASARASYYQTLVTAGIMTRNQAMKLENLPTVPGGDTYLVQGAMVPLDEDGKPESDFAGNGNPAPVAPPMDDDSEDDEEDTMAAVVMQTQRILSRDLRWLLTKEGKAVGNFAKKPDRFLSMVDAFYTEHSAFMVDAVSDTIAALTACGVNVDREAFIAGWIREGRAAILEASGIARPDELAEAIRSVVESRTWTERPVRAVEALNQRNELAAA